MDLQSTRTKLSKRNIFVWYKWIWRKWIFLFPISKRRRVVVQWRALVWNAIWMNTNQIWSCGGCQGMFGMGSVVKGCLGWGATCLCSKSTLRHLLLRRTLISPFGIYYFLETTLRQLLDNFETYLVQLQDNFETALEMCHIILHRTVIFSFWDILLTLPHLLPPQIRCNHHVIWPESSHCLPLSLTHWCLEQACPGLEHFFPTLKWVIFCLREGGQNACQNGLCTF